MLPRKKKTKEATPMSGWMVTFSDLVTLLLTFFVLLLSMSTMDQSVVTRAFTNFWNDAGFLQYMSSSELPTRHDVAASVFEKPWEVLEKQTILKDLLFPDHLLPPEVTRKTLEENIKILLRPEGISLVLADTLLFKPGEWTLREEAQFIVHEIGDLLLVMSAPVNIAGYTDSLPGSNFSNYDLAAKRALSVATYLFDRGFEKKLLSLSAYGPHFPVAENTTAAGRSTNRRVEILIKKNFGFETYF